MASGEPVIQVKDLSNVFDEFAVHEHLNFNVNEGEVVAIIGNSGSGKTTLLRSILMLNKPTSGKVYVFNHDIYNSPGKVVDKIREQWGVMFQSGALFGGFTVLENVMFPMMEFTSLKKADMEHIALFRIILSGLDRKAAYQFPADLSGGMKKRAAMARAIALEPRLLFLDEPTAGLDPQSAEALDNLVLYLKEQLGLTIVMVTHDLDTLWHVTDRVAFLGEGRVLTEGPVDKVAAYPHELVQMYFSGYRAETRIKSGEKHSG